MFVTTHRIAHYRSMHALQYTSEEEIIRHTCGDLDIHKFIINVRGKDYREYYMLYSINYLKRLEPSKIFLNPGYLFVR